MEESIAALKGDGPADTVKRRVPVLLLDTDLAELLTNIRGAKALIIRSATQVTASGSTRRPESSVV